MGLGQIFYPQSALDSLEFQAGPKLWCTEPTKWFPATEMILSASTIPIPAFFIFYFPEVEVAEPVWNSAFIPFEHLKVV